MSPSFSAIPCRGHLRSLTCCEFKPSTKGGLGQTARCPCAPFFEKEHPMWTKKSGLFCLAAALMTVSSCSRPASEPEV